MTNVRSLTRTTRTPLECALSEEPPTARRRLPNGVAFSSRSDTARHRTSQITSVLNARISPPPKAEYVTPLRAVYGIENENPSVSAIEMPLKIIKVPSVMISDGVPVLVNAAVKDTGGIPANRSAALADAERTAQRITDEYGGHPEDSSAITAAYMARVPSSGKQVPQPPEEEQDPEELERERIGVDAGKYMNPLFSPPVVPDNGAAGVNQSQARGGSFNEALGRARRGHRNAAALETDDLSQGSRSIRRARKRHDWLCDFRDIA